MARGLPTDGAARVFLLLRSVHSPRGLDVQPTREVAEGVKPRSVAPPHCLSELPSDIACVAAGPQRVQPPRPGVYRSRGEHEGGRGAGVSAAGREYAPVRRGSLFAPPAVRERYRGRKAARAAVAEHGGGDRALLKRGWNLGMGFHGPGSEPDVVMACAGD